MVAEDSQIFLFADDTKVHRKINSEADKKILQQDINSLLMWSELWLLKFHPDKCIYMGIGYMKDKEIYTTYEMDGHILKRSTCEKDLGVYIDDELKFDTHISNIVNKANRNLAIVRKTFDYMDCTTFNYIFKGLIRPHLEYAAPIWSPHHIKQKEILENVQRRATKMVPGLAQLSYSERLKKLKLPTLAYRRIRGDMIQVYKLTSGCYDSSVPSLLTHSTTGLRGHSKKLYITRSDKDIRKYNFSVRVQKIWNSLPDQVVNAKDIINFEKSLDSYWSDQEIMYDNFKADIRP